MDELMGGRVGWRWKVGCVRRIDGSICGRWKDGKMGGWMEEG